MKLNIYQLSDREHQDSFWYDGLVAETDNFCLVATGEIKIYKEDELIYDGKSRGSGFNPKTDKDLPYDDNGEIWFENNNWFEVYSNEAGYSGEVYDTYNEALLGLIYSQQEFNEEK
jgi:hypothetical protein